MIGDISQAELGVPFTDPAEFLWQVVANKVVTTQEELKSFYVHIRFGGNFPNAINVPPTDCYDSPS